MDGGTGHRLHARDAGPAGPVLRNLRGGSCRPVDRRGCAGHPAARPPTDRHRRPDARGHPTRRADRGSERGGAAIRQVQSGGGARGR